MPGPRVVPSPGAHGGDGSVIARALGLDPASMLDLSASMNPVAPDAASVLSEILRGSPNAITTYPDPADATDALASAIGVPPDLLVLTNGGAEAIAMVAHLVREGSIVEPEFSLYRRHLARVADDAPRWRSNPSNPAGELADPADRAGVWDEAYYPLAVGRWTRGDEDCWRLGSLTKLWHCPGLRLGYAIAPDRSSAEALRALQPRWSVNGLALAGVAPLLERTDLPAFAGEVASVRRHVVGELRSLGWSVRDTAANWVLVEEPDLRARLAPSGVVVRDCGSFGLPGIARIAVPRRADVDRLVSACAAAAASSARGR